MPPLDVANVDPTDTIAVIVGGGMLGAGAGVKGRVVADGRQGAGLFPEAPSVFCLAVPLSRRSPDVAKNERASPPNGYR